MSKIVVFGGSGFLGRRLVKRLSESGMSVLVAVRHPDRAREALRKVGVSRVRIASADVRDERTVARAFDGADAVVNAVSAYTETGGVTFEAVHVHGAETLAKQAAAAGVSRLVLVSGIGADERSKYPYIRTRGRGEAVTRDAFPNATIVRPGAVFGHGDALFGTLTALARTLPVLPLIGGGRTRLQPVFVDDVAAAIAAVLADPGTAGLTFELAGPRTYSLRDLTRYALRFAGKQRWLMPIPFAVADLQARLFELLPNPPLTTDQVDLLRADNVASGTLPGFRELGIEPKLVEEIMPAVFGRDGV